MCGCGCGKRIIPLVWVKGGLIGPLTGWCFKSTLAGDALSLSVSPSLSLRYSLSLSLCLSVSVGLCLSVSMLFSLSLSVFLSLSLYVVLSLCCSFLFVCLSVC